MIGLFVLAQIVVVAHGPDTATTCAPFEITVAARAPGIVAPHIAPVALGPTMQLLRNTVTNRVERDGAGNPSTLSEAVFTMATEGSGRVALPQFVATVGAQHANAPVAPVEAHVTQPLAPTVIVRAWMDRNGHEASSDSLYVGQQVDYVVDVQLNEVARQRLRRNPTFFPPEMPGVLAYDLSPPATVSRTGRRCFETLSYRRALFPLFAGRTVIAPAALTYSLPLSTSFFSREETFELHTDSVRFVAVDVPVQGRPADFAGAVGSVAASSRVSTSKARMGDPVVVTLRLEGAGNVKLWPRPQLKLSWATVANGEERVQVDTSQARVRGSKEFDWLLTPRAPGTQQLAGIDYSFFDADRSTYDVAHAQPLALEITPGSLAAIDSTPATRLAVRRTLREEEPDPLQTRPWFWLAFIVAPVPAAVRRVRRGVRPNRKAPTPALRLKSAARSKALVSPADLRRLFLGAVQARVPQANGSSRHHEFVRALRIAGVTDETAIAAGDLLARLDRAAFARDETIDASAAPAAWALARKIDEEAVRPSSRGNGVLPLGMLLCLVFSATSLDALPENVTRSFQQGVSAYDHGAFAASQHYFARVVARAPRAADAWSDLGTAAWARGDSAAAIRGWQRALRLDPLDAEIRDRLDVVQASALRSPAYVPPVSIDLIAAAAVACWIIAWIGFAIPRARRPEALNPLVSVALVFSIILLVTSVGVRERLDPSGLAVLRSNRSLVQSPGSATAVASATIGETGALGAREGAWVRITLDGGRSGWIPVDSVLPLDAPPADD